MTEIHEENGGKFILAHIVRDLEVSIHLVSEGVMRNISCHGGQEKEKRHVPARSWLSPLLNLYFICVLRPREKVLLTFGVVPF